MWNATVRKLELNDKLKASSMAGCKGLSVAPSDYTKWIEMGLSAADIKAMASDFDIKIVHLDPFVRWVKDWKPNVPEELLPSSMIKYDIDDFFRIATALEVRSFTAFSGFQNGRYSKNELIDRYGELCLRAKQEGLRCDLEFMPVFQISDLRSAWEIVNAVNLSNSGIVLDMWHYFRGNPDNELLSKIPGEKISAVQLCDAPTMLEDDISLLEEGLRRRLEPGEGDFPVDETLKVLNRTGGINNIGVEVFSEKFDSLNAQDIAEITKKCLDAALNTR
jgi:4-hydroxyphenylpyruvate dioxygenase